MSDKKKRITYYLKDSMSISITSGTKQLENIDFSKPLMIKDLDGSLRQVIPGNSILMIGIKDLEVNKNDK